MNHEICPSCSAYLDATMTCRVCQFPARGPEKLSAYVEDWCKRQAKTIHLELLRQWGNGYRRLGVELQRALVAEKILSLLLSQQLEHYKPAHDLIRAIMADPRYPETEV